MSNDTNRDDPRDHELESWLDELGGRGDGDDAVAERLRKLIRQDQYKAEAEIDELRLRRGRAQLLDTARASESPAPSKRARPFAIAASFLLMLAAGFFAYQLTTVPDAELLMSYGDLERVRGAFPTLDLDVDDPSAAALAAGKRLEAADIPFEIWQEADGRFSLRVTARDDAEAEVLKEIIGETDPGLPELGYYVIHYN